MTPQHLAALLVMLFVAFPLQFAAAGVVPVPENFDIFVEGEHWVATSGFDRTDPPAGLAYSGGRAANLWKLDAPEGDSYFVEYEVKINKPSRYYIIVWAQGLDTPFSSSFHAVIDDNDLNFTASSSKMLAASSERYGDDITPHVMGPINIHQGKHLLKIKVQERRAYIDRAYNLVLDAIAVTQEVPSPLMLQPEAKITVDGTSATGSFTAMNNMAQGGIKEVTDPHFWASIAPIITAIHLRNVRIDHIFDDSYYGIVARDGSGRLTYRWEKLDAVLEQLLAAGSRPFFCLSYMPGAISRGRDPYGPPRSLNEWAAVCRALVKHVKTRFGLEGLYYEVWNEPDLSTFWKGSQQEYFDLYRASVVAVTQADKNAKVGGPTTALMTMPWIQAFLDFVKNSRLPLHFVSWHLYHMSPRAYANQIKYVKQTMAESGFTGAIETIISEWNFRGYLHPDNDAFYNCGHSAAVFKVFHDEGLDKAFFFSVKDSRLPSDISHGEWGLVRGDGTSKPVFSMFKAYARMAGTSLRVDVSDYTVNAMAARNGDKLKILIWSYNEGIPFGTQRKVLLDVVLRDAPSQSMTFSECSIDACSESYLNHQKAHFKTELFIENGGVRFVEIARAP